MTNDTLESAKSTVLAEQERIIAHLPADLVVSTYVGDEATVLECGEGYTWPGVARVELEQGVDMAAVISAMVSDFEAEGEWVVTPLADDGHFRTELRHSGDQRGHFIGFDALDGTVFAISSFSSCFEFTPRIGEKY